MPILCLNFLKRKKMTDFSWQRRERRFRFEDTYIVCVYIYIYIRRHFSNRGRFAAQQRQWPRNKSDSNYTERLVLADATRSVGSKNKKFRPIAENPGARRGHAGRRILNPARPIFRLVPVKGWLSRLFHSDAAKYRAAARRYPPAQRRYPDHPLAASLQIQRGPTYEPH